MVTAHDPLTLSLGQRRRDWKGATDGHPLHTKEEESQESTMIQALACKIRRLKTDWSSFVKCFAGRERRNLPLGVASSRDIALNGYIDGKSNLKSSLRVGMKQTSNKQHHLNCSTALNSQTYLSYMHEGNILEVSPSTQYATCPRVRNRLPQRVRDFPDPMSNTT